MLNVIYRWAANSLPKTVVVLCAVRATRMYMLEPKPLYPLPELRKVEQVFINYAGNAAIGF